METLQTAIVGREDTGPFKKPLIFTKEHCVIEDPDETNYVDLGDPVDMRSDITKTVKVTFTGEGNQLAIFKCNNDESGLGITVPVKQEDNDNAESGSSEDLASENGEKCISAGHFAERATLRDGYLDALKPRKLRAAPREAEELRYTDMYLNSRSEPKDGSSAADAESHYITTHEIQLTELDHDVDYEFGRGSCWDYEDDNLVYSFVDYASFDSSETTLRRIKSKTKSNRIPPTLRESGALVSTESELCESDKCVSSDEGVGHLRNPAGHIHLSIKASSLGINDAASVLQENNVRFNARRAGERSQYSFRSSDSKSEALFDRFFIPPPGRQHLASKLRGKDINEYSSGASSSVSELDDADNEVRNLTARSFRSLACPYFDAINLSSSSESSMSEHGLNLNKWSAFVDLNYGNLTRDAYKDSVDGSKVLERTSLKDAVPGAVTNTQTKLISLKNNLNSQHASTIEIRNKSGIGETIKLTETLNLRCNVGSVMPARAKRALNAIMSRSAADAARATPTKPGGEGESQFRDTAEAAGDVHNKAVFASSLLKNVISKKMQLEQERKMERGEISGAFSAPSQFKDCKENWCKQSSDSESGHSQEEVHGETEQPLEKTSSPAAEITKLPCDANTTPQLDQNDKNPTSLSQANILETLNDGEQDTCDGEYQRALEDSQPDASIRPMMESSECVEGESSKMIKMSHLYVPSSQLMPKENEAPGFSLHNRKVTGDLAESNGGGCGKQNSGQLQGSMDIDQTSPSPNAPEIKIHLQTVKENQSNLFNITNLLTPNIQANLPTKKPTSPKSNLLTMSDKVPHFMVRDIRDSKCKFQTPIHQVRDVRKLVKSSYRFVALENTNGTAGTSTITTFQDDNKPVITGIDKILVPSPMVIKCQSVNTNSGSKPCESKTDDGEIVSEASNLSPKCQTKCDVPHGAFKMPHGKPPATEQPEFHFKIDAKSKQKLEKSSDCSEKKSETKVSNQIAFEKLKAAVKTMEQLYVFDRNEWKRKIRAPRPITDSHVLSLITREDNEKITGSSTNAEKNAPYSSVSVAEDKKSPFLREDPVNQKGNCYDKCVFSTASSLKTQSCETTANESALQMLPTRSFTPKAHRLPLALKICPKKAQNEDKEKDCVSHSDSDNYLTIPVKTQSDSRLNSIQPHSKPPHRPLQRSPISTESWSPDYTTSSVYHHAVSLPAVQTLPPTQPKLLLDPTTGQYYLVDTPVPVPPAAQRFYHPESGQYVDIPVSITPVPVSVSPITLSPVAAYSPTYVVYPPTLLPPQIHQAPMSRSSTCSEGEDTVEMGSVYLIPPSSGIPSTTKPVISITSQQGARIVAPPSFDGTTMSFVVEHR